MNDMQAQLRVGFLQLMNFRVSVNTNKCHAFVCSSGDIYYIHKMNTITSFDKTLLTSIGHTGVNNYIILVYPKQKKKKLGEKHKQLTKLR
jgi:hypothetical protein